MPINPAPTRQRRMELYGDGVSTIGTRCAPLRIERCALSEKSAQTITVVHI